jgi:hypothetical protein
MIFGGKDQRIVNTPNYRKFNPDCSGMDLSTSTLDVPTFRKILQCFNSNGALEPIQNLMNHLSDEELQPIVFGMNQHVLNNSKMLFQIDQTYQKLDKEGVADTLFYELGKILENVELISNSIALFREGFDKHGDDLLLALELVSRDLSDEDLIFALDLASSVSTEGSFKSLNQNLSKDVPVTSRSAPLRTWVGELFYYVQESHNYTCGTETVPMSRELMASILANEPGVKEICFPPWTRSWVRMNLRLERTLYPWPRSSKIP